MTSTRAWTTMPCSSRTSTYSGFQATNFGLAVEEINKMISKRCVLLSRLHSVISCPIQGGADTRGKERVMLQHRARSRGENYNTIHSWCIRVEPCNMQVKNNCTIFLRYTSNMASCGVRETLRCQLQTEVDKITPEQVPGPGRLSRDKCRRHRGGLHQVLNLNNRVWRIVNGSKDSCSYVHLTSIRCLAPTYLGAFDLPGKQLREKGINRYVEQEKISKTNGNDHHKICQRWEM